MEHTRGEAEMKSTRGEVRSRLHMRSGPPGSYGPEDLSAGPGGGGVGGRGGAFERARSRAAEIAGRTREGFNSAMDRMDSLAGDLPFVSDPVRKHPVAAVGIAFSVGLALAALGGRRERHWVFERARHQLRTILVSAATAALVSEIHDMLDADEDDEDGDEVDVGFEPDLDDDDF
jgi:hypothetical protein